jgi:dihydropteroate synthase
MPNFKGSTLFASKLTFRDRELVWGSRTFVMGILNITPDSFSGDGLVGAAAPDDQPENGANVLSRALSQADRFVKTGVDILDVGGESTRPGSQPVTEEQEIERVIPVVQMLASRLDVPVSIDTYRAGVADAAIRAGASMINDVWGFKADPDLAGVAARHNVPVVLMHNRSSWANAEIKERLGGRYIGIPYDDLLADIRQELLESVEIARSAGVPDKHIIVDPGIGFGKTVEQNLELLDRLDEIRSLGYPILFGPSRKSFIGYTLDLPTDQRLEGTAAAVTIGIVRRGDIVRVHDVEYMRRVTRMADAIVRRASQPLEQTI